MGKRVFLCSYEGYVGEGKTLKEAFDDLGGDADLVKEIEDCEFYVAEKIEVEVTIEQVKSITEK